MIKKIIACIFLLFILISGLSLFIYFHETAHWRIFKVYGCDSTISLDLPNLKAITSPEKNCNYTPELRQMQGYVEILGFSLFPFYLILLAILSGLWLKLIIDKSET